jgi:hypothetical protein
MKKRVKHIDMRDIVNEGELIQDYLFEAKLYNAGLSSKIADYNGKPKYEYAE